jgi:hypothetical protein
MLLYKLDVNCSIASTVKALKLRDRCSRRSLLSFCMSRRLLFQVALMIVDVKRDALLVRFRGQCAIRGHYHVIMQKIVE